MFNNEMKLEREKNGCCKGGCKLVFLLFHLRFDDNLINKQRLHLLRMVGNNGNLEYHNEA